MKLSSLLLAGAALAVWAGAQSPSSPSQAVDDLDQLVQELMADLTLTQWQTVTVKTPDGKTKQVRQPPIFGFSRMPLLTVRHNRGISEPRGKQMQDLARRVRESGWHVKAFGVGRNGRPLRKGEMRVGDSITSGFGRRGGNASIPQDDVLRFAQKALPQLARREKVQGRIAGMYAEARPIRLSKKECLSCHSGSKLGDPLAVAVYVAQPDASRQPKPRRVSSP